MREVLGSIPGAAHVLSLPFVERDSNVGEEPGLEREGAQEQLGGTGGVCSGGNVCDSGDHDTLPERFKGGGLTFH